jgi:hypothetical protein
LTTFEERVFAAVWADFWRRWTSQAHDPLLHPGLPAHDPELRAASEAFESATYAVLTLRRLKIQPVFGAGTGAAGIIEAHLLGQLGAPEGS